MARGAGLAGRVSSHKRTACDINVVMQRQPWQLKLGAGTQEHQRLQRLNGVCKLLHLRRPGVAAPSRKCCDPGRARESDRTVEKFERHSCRRSSFDVSSRQPQPAPHDPNRPHTATQQALVTTLLFAWRRTVSSEPTGVGAAAEHHGKRVTDLHIN